jgi:Ran GTPase-activating protein (RanGAP) involved in mRNA processing and transport
MNKLCVFDKAKICNDCGVCDICDLNPKKKCNNCGKCLELEGYDMKAINIDEIFEDNKELNEYEENDKLHIEGNNISEDEIEWDYIDDIREVKDLINDEETLENYEEFPGFINLSKHKN